MIKKIIPLILSVCLIFGYTPAFAYEKGEASDSSDMAYALLVNLGILEDGESYELIKNNTVTREKFALYLSRLFNIWSPNGYNKFSDISGATDEEKAVISLGSADILSGFGDGTFRPKENITVTETAIASLRALGYKPTVNWSTDRYLREADKIKLFDGISNRDKSSMGDLVVLLYNVLHADRIEYDYTDDKLETPLESVFKLKYIKGVLTANAYASFSGERTSSADYVAVDNVIYKTETADAADMLGYKVIAYISAESGNIVYCFKDTDNTVMTIGLEEFDEYDDGTVLYTPENTDRQKRVHLTSDAVIIRNSALVGTDYKSAFDGDFGTITFVSYDGSKYNAVIIDSYENYNVTGVDVSKKTIYTDKKDENGDFISVSLDGKDFVKIEMLPYGKEVNENTIEPDDLLSLSISDDKSIVRGYLCAETVNGKVEEIFQNNGKTYITVNGTEYKTDPEFFENSDITLNTQGEFVLDAKGRFAAFRKDNSAVNEIGYIYDLYTADNRRDINVKIYGLNRTHTETVLADKVKFNGTPEKKEAVKTALCTLSGGQLKRQLIKFKLNSENKVSQIDTAYESKEAKIGDNVLYTQLEKGTYQWYYQMKTFGRQYVLSNNTYYMRVPGENDDTNDKALFGCQSFKNVTWYNQDASKNILGLYKFNDDTPYADVLVVPNSDGSTLTNQTEITVVSSISKKTGPDGDPTYAVHGYCRGNEVTAYIPESDYKNDIGEGDIIRFATNIYGLAKSYEIVYDYSEDKTSWEDETGDKYTYVKGGLRYTFGYVNNLYIAPYTTGLNSVLQIGSSPDVIENTYQTNTSQSSTTRFIVVDKNRRTDKVYMGHFDEITSYEASKSFADTSRVFVHTRSGWLIAVIIYK